LVENYLQLAPNCPDQAGLVIHQMAIAVLPKFAELKESEQWLARQWVTRMAQASLPKNAYRQLPLAF
jgi:hypothetical protein